MNNNDINTWKELHQDLSDTVEQNKVIIREIKEEVELQKQRNKKEVQALSDEIAAQLADLESLLKELDQTELFTLPSDLKTRDSFIATLTSQLDKSRNLVNYSSSLLDSQTTPESTIEKIKVGTRRNKERVHNYLPKLFRQEHILGNWVHRFNENQFTCQSFWDDDTFKEYDFDHGKLVEEREGTYSIDQDKVSLRYQDGTKMDYTVTGFSDETISYQINKSKMDFDYMPEATLNQFLDEDSVITADYSLKAES
ncbi:hypothetical protein [Ileibacterium valens]|uniref:hypothetical protein n=1 Tax=Ileibacterium valens TaxID=1862668 RepID=UPI0023522EE5|nr:hypothetical protein [Ileibacterium valens]